MNNRQRRVERTSSGRSGVDVEKGGIIRARARAELCLGLVGKEGAVVVRVRHVDAVTQLDRRGKG
jgi:hypothetical protein